MRIERCFLCVAAAVVLAGCGAGRERVCLRAACYAVDVAVTDAARARGLMFRKQLPPGQGMLFVFDRQGIYPFWMKNMSFAIDILWLDNARRVVHIETQVLPCRTDACPVQTPAAPARYVLEIPAGDVLRYGIKPGDTLH